MLEPNRVPLTDEDIAYLEEQAGVDEDETREALLLEHLINPDELKADMREAGIL